MTTTTCLICGGEPHAIGVFTPFDGQPFGAPEGKRRTVGYTLCAVCAADPVVFGRIEKIIEHALAGSSLK
jgi:hypothetical protein